MVEQIASLILGLGIGGAVGALATVLLSGTKLARAIEDFASRFKKYAATQSGAAIDELKASFAEVESSASRLIETVLRAKRALRWK